MLATERFTQEAILKYRSIIADAGFNEVFAVGKLDENGLVSSLEAAARGHKNAVVAIAPALEGFLSKADVLIHNHPGGRLEPSDADMAIAIKYAENGLGSYIVNSDVTRVYVVTEPLRTRALVAIDPEELAAVLDKGGKLAMRLPGYEARKSQLDLVRCIASAFNDGQVLAAEAGTGVGKSFAYLLPAMAWAVKNKERVVISTATINLQGQLMGKDIPLIAGLFKKDVKTVLVKGRGNYLCRNRLMEALDEEGLLASNDDHPLRKIALWAETSPSGDKSDLSFWPEDSLWARVRSEADSCLGIRCPFREKCFVLIAKRNAADADILVANHHILFSDISLRASGSSYEAAAILPPYTSIIFDEAHSIESSATSLFTSELKRFNVQKELSRLYREYKGRKFGLILKLQNLKGLPKGLLKRFPKEAEKLQAAMDSLDSSAMSLLEAEASFRLVKTTRLLESLILEPMAALERAILSMTALLKEALDKIPEELANEQIVYEAERSLSRLSNLAAFCFNYRNFSEDLDNIFWLEKAKTSNGTAYPVFYICPLEIGSILNESLFCQFRTIVCLSATLSVAGSFDYWANRTGLAKSGAEALFYEFPSPFPYKKNALLGAVKNAPDPNDPVWQSWINTAIFELLVASQGRALVLFTSYTSLSSAWNQLKEKLSEIGIPCFRQGEDERSRLLAKFKADTDSVLFATDSFWEGVDAPGNTLKLVIIVKLPFKVPNDPVMEARSEAIEKKGGSAFMDLALPEAVIKLKQGFGRLIRHSEDRGAVVILDTRLLKKQYGKVFISSLPESKQSFNDISTLCRDVKDFLDNIRMLSNE